jgi:ADP-heptose:LPS heptosyltransferase
VGIDPSRGKTGHVVIPEIFSYLANNLASRRKVKFLVLLHPWSGKLMREFSVHLKSEALDLAPSNVKESISLLSQCDLFIAGNTDLFHYAAALNVPTIGLFTKYDGKKWIPEASERVRIFKGTRGKKLSLSTFFNKVDEVLRSEKISIS